MLQTGAEYDCSFERQMVYLAKFFECGVSGKIRAFTLHYNDDVYPSLDFLPVDLSSLKFHMKSKYDYRLERQAEVKFK